MTTRESLASLRRKSARLWSAGEALRFKAPAGALAAGDKEEVRRRKVEILSHLCSAALGSGAIVPVAGNGPLPLAFSQQRLWLVNQLGTGAACNMPWTVRLEGEQDAGAGLVGGDSQMATQVISRVLQTFNLELALQRPFERPTIAEQEIDTVGWLLPNRTAGAKIESGSV